MWAAVLLQLNTWVPASASEWGLLAVILSNAMLWDRMRRLSEDIARLEKRLSLHFVEVPRKKGGLKNEREGNSD